MRELAVGAGCRVVFSDSPVEHEHAERHVAEQRAELGGFERALPAICLELADIVEQRAGEDELDVRAADLGDGAADGRDLAGMPQQAAELGMVARACWPGTARSGREIVVGVEQVERAAEPRAPDLAAPAIEGVPVRARRRRRTGRRWRQSTDAGGQRPGWS